MHAIHYIDRADGKEKKEAVSGEASIRLVYGSSALSRAVGPLLLFFGKRIWFSRLYGWFQNHKSSARRARKFINDFQVDASEFVKSPEAFTSFNDFFIRELKPECRPIAPGEETAIIPADGRYRFMSKMELETPFTVKGRAFCLATFLQSETLARRYANGAAVFARLCPTDCHRFYFPVSATTSGPRLIEGPLYSVNPIAIRKHPWIFQENRRYLSLLTSPQFGSVAMVEVGATMVGTVIETCKPDMLYPKGAEKGYFSIGGSAIVLLFEPGSLELADDLVELSRKGLEVRCLIGQPLGRVPEKSAPRTHTNSHRDR